MSNPRKIHNSTFIIQHSLVLALYVIIAAAMTWPLLADLGGHILRGRVDEYMYLWGFWWMKYSLGTLHTWPFHTDLLYYPFGTELAFHTWSPLLGTLSIPIQNLWGTEVAFNLAIFASYVFSAFTMYLLVDYLVKDKRAAFVGGLVFAFSTFKFYQTTGHIHVISTEFFPIFLLFFIKLLRETDYRRRHALFAGLSLGFIFLIDYYQTVYALFFSLCYLIYYLFGRQADSSPNGEGSNREQVSSPAPLPAAGEGNLPPHSSLLTHHSSLPLGIAIEQPLPALPRRGLWVGRRIADRRLLLTTAGLLLILGAVFIVIGSPLLVADYIAIKNGYYVKWPGEDQYFADALAFFVPTNPIFSGWQAGGTDWWNSMTAWHSQPTQATNLVQQAIGSFFNGTEAMVFIGYVTLLLIIIGAVRLWHKPDYRFWLIFALIAFLFALGPTPHFAGNTITLPGDRSFWNALPFVHQDAAGNPLMPGPYALWAAIPFLNNARVPSRFDMLFTLAAAVMVGYALRDLFAALTHRLVNPFSSTGGRVRTNRIVTTLFLFAISFAILFENFVMPYLADGGHQLDEPSAAYAQIAAEPNNYAVLNLPEYSGIDPEFNYEHTMYDQTMHHKPVLFAGISRPLLIYKPYYIRERYINLLTQTAATLQPMQDNLRIALADPLLMQFYREEGARLLYYLNIGYIVVHPPALAPEAMQFINSTLPLAQLYPAGPPHRQYHRLPRIA